MRPISPTGRTPVKSRGFTLLEVIVVIVLIAAVAGLVWPEMHRSIKRIEGKSALHQIKRDLALLADEAKGTNLSAKIVFTPGSGEYRLQWGGKSVSRSLQGLVFQGEKTVVLTHSSTGSWVGPAELVFRNAEGNKLSISTGAIAEDLANTSGDEEESVGDELDESDDDGEWDEGAEAADEIHVSEEGLY